MKTGNSKAMFDVTSKMAESAKSEWRKGPKSRWYGKVTIHDLWSWLSSLDHIVEDTEIDTYLASVKEEDLDQPLKAREIRERFNGAKSIEDIPMTRMATRWFNQQQHEGRPASQNRRFWEMFVKRAQNDRLQVVLEVAKGLFDTIAKRQDLAEAGPDKTVDLATGEMLTCMFAGCGCKGNPWQTKQIVNDQVVLHGEGPLEGKPVRFGNFATILKENGNYETHFFCREHTRLFVQSGGSTLSYEDAEAVTAASNKERDDANAARKKKEQDAEAMKRMAANSPNVAVKQKYSDVRMTRDNNRTRRR